MPHNYDMSNMTKSWKTKYFFLVETIGAKLRNFELEVFQKFDDVFTTVHEGFGILCGRALTGLSYLFGILVFPIQKAPVRYRILLIPIKIVVGLPLLAIFLATSVLVGAFGGSIGGAVGLRNLGEYSRKEQIAAWGFALTLGLLIPKFANSYFIYKISLCYVFSIILLGLNFLYGQCGVISIGHAAFVLVGAFLTTLLYNGCLGHQFPFILSLVISATFAGCLGYLLGAPSLRIKDHYLMVITLAFTVAIPQIVRSHYVNGLANVGQEGVQINPIPAPGFLQPMDNQVWAYYYIFTAFILFVIFAYNIQVNSLIGRAFRFIKCDDVIARAQGINVAKYKLMAFVISAFFAAFGGGLMMMLSDYVSSESYTLFDSIDYFIGLAVGGPASILGSIFGAAFLAFESDFTKAVAKNFYGGQSLMRLVYGVLLIIMICFLPDGISGLVKKIANHFFEKKIRRGSYYMLPPPDYDIVAAKDYRDIKEQRRIS